MLAAQAVNGLKDVPAATVICSDCQGQPGIGRGHLLRTFYEINEFLVETRDVTDRTKTNAVLMQPVNFLLQGTDKELHQQRHFVCRATPVFAAEGKKRQRLDAAIRTSADNTANGFNPFVMPGNTWQKAPFGPATVAIHDNCDVARHTTYSRNFLGGTGH